ncbi:hypothetical protein, partial [Streptomyces syringium]|uniref:hypothetical protein n=1 Tax=Streptomyces syringium TaxID=76729 RepID=UPI0033B9D179
MARLGTRSVLGGWSAAEATGRAEPGPGPQRGCHVYRTIEDVAAIRSRAAGARTGVVVGGGL